MTRTAVACPEPERRRNEPVAWTTTATGNATTGWVRIDASK